MPPPPIGEGTRVVFRLWPRDPNGQIAPPKRGKEAPNGLDLWGATLCDFYRVKRIPSCSNDLTVSTGSMLAASMRELGEIEWAGDEIALADEEQEPHEVFPYDIGKLIRDMERNVRERKANDTWDDIPTSTELTGSCFNRTFYSPPWPLKPFSVKAPILQKRIPYHLLPKTLVIHDPNNVLPANLRSTREGSWSDNDTIRRYTLKLTEDGQRMVGEDRALAEKAIEESNQQNFIAVGGDCGFPGPSKPLLIVSHPRGPGVPLETPEAHLYLSKDSVCGTGHHSVVYNAEWELPRSVLVEEPLCRLCLLEKLDVEIRKHDEFTPSGLLTDMDVHVYHDVEVEFPSYDIAMEDTTTQAPIDTQEREEATVDGDNPKSEAQEKTTGKVVAIKEATVRYKDTYTGPIILVHAEPHWLSPEGSPGCLHFPTVPPTAKVIVTAKLSRGRDGDLNNEATNYQLFPRHLFQHYNGYNIVPPLRDPVPVGAVLPQFYGYYVREDKATMFDGYSFDEGYYSYSSPVLLIENCGDVIRPRDLDRDDRQECASLLFRFHHAGWVHCSVAPHNVAVQYGPLTSAPNDRDRVRSFRLIDFGGSWEINDDSERIGEVAEARRMLRLNR